MKVDPLAFLYAMSFKLRNIQMSEYLCSSVYHTRILCEEGGQDNFVDSVRCVCVWVNTRCAVFGYSYTQKFDGLNYLQLFSLFLAVKIITL